MKISHFYRFRLNPKSLSGQKVLTECGNFVAKQVCETRSKIMVWLKNSRVWQLCIPTGFPRLNPKSLCGLKIPYRVWQLCIPTGFPRLDPNSLCGLKSLTEHDNFIFVQVSRPNSKLLSGLKRPNRVRQFHIPTGF